MIIKKILKPFVFFAILQLAVALPATATSNILYLNSTRGRGTGSLGNFRSTIADFIDNYEDGNVFDVDFVQTHVSGDLASFLNAKPIDYYDQIWFDTTIYNSSLLSIADIDALNIWSANKQPEFILDSSFFFRNKNSNTMSASAGSMTVNQALALQDVGGGIFIGTDHNSFAHTANQVLANFGFDNFFTGINYITSNGSFVGDSLVAPNTVGSDFFTNHLQGLYTSNVPIGTHVLNENGGNRTINIYENLFSHSPNKIAHIGTSFDPGSRLSDITNPEPPPESVPEPGSIWGLFLLGGFGVRSLLLRISQ